MRPRRTYVCAMLLIILSGTALCAQSLPVVASYSLSSSTSTDTTTRIINDLVFSFIRELRTYRMLDMRTEPLPADMSVPAGADYLFYGNLVEQSDGIKLELVLKGGPDHITRMISRVYENTNRILLESRMLVRDLFDQSILLPDPVQESGSVAPGPDAKDPPAGNRTALFAVRNMDSLAGSWHGEDGVEKIMILRGGRAVAVLSTGLSISLELSLSGDTLVVRQKSPANIRQFPDLSDPVARQAAAIAPPLEWNFLVSQDQKKLSGTKKTVTFKNDGENIIAMEPVVLDVAWTRD